MDIEDLQKPIDDKLTNFVISLSKKQPKTHKEYEKIHKQLRRKYRICPSKIIMNEVYQNLVNSNRIQKNPIIEYYLIKKAVRSRSGVVVITVVMKPDKFSCTKDCYYCPNETKKNGSDKDMPRSYLSTEPAVMRGSQNDFDACLQMWSRMNSLRILGHKIDKLEIIVLGGTFSIYPREYQEEFCRDLFYAANNFPDLEFTHETSGKIKITENCIIRNKETLKQEQKINESTKCKIIGISLETRPDFINKYELRRFRMYGCTRVQLGVQHTNNDVLKIVNRDHKVEDSERAIKQLKDASFKVDIHIMPDLPGTNPEVDRKMFQDVFLGESLQADYVKIYPCLDVKYTKIREWKQQGKWKPYAEENGGKDLFDVLLYAKQIIPPYIRINRLQRDFPEESNKRAGFKSENIRSNLRQQLLARMKHMGKRCECIRCREVKNKEVKQKNVKLIIRSYRASEGIEYFISYEDVTQDILLGFIRLRIPDSQNKKTQVFPVLSNAALVRELHVYGMMKPTTKDKSQTGVQHYGYGKKLLKKAEQITKNHELNKVVIISGVGVRNYYRKFGYKLKETYMVKELLNTNIQLPINNNEIDNDIESYNSMGQLVTSIFMIWIYAAILGILKYYGFM